MKAGQEHRTAWVGDSKDTLLSFHKEIVLEFSRALGRLQQGERPLCEIRPLSSIETGLWELKTQDDAGWYRLIYLTPIDGVIYIIDCFVKKTARMTKSDEKRIKQRITKVHAQLGKG